jgi:hypothetical protein
MEYPNPKIKFYKVRTLSERMTIVFEFLRENWKPLLIFSFYLILPICLFQAFSMNAYTRLAFSMGYESAAGAIDSFILTFVRNFLILMFFMLLGNSVLYGLVYGLMNEYERRDSRLMQIKLEDFKKPLIRNVWKIFRASLFFFGVLMVVCGFVVLLALSATETLFLTIPVFTIGIIVVWVPINLFTPVYLFEEISFFEAIKKSFRLGFSSWGETFVIILVFGFLGNIISGVTMVPWYIVMMFGEVFSLTEPGAGLNASLWYKFITYLLGIIQSYGTYVSYILGAVGIAFQYFHIREKQEGISFDANIQNFERL